MKAAELDKSSKNELKFRITDKLILTVLEQVHNECIKQGDTCRGCPWFGNGCCALSGIEPGEWDIKALTRQKDYKKKGRK